MDVKGTSSLHAGLIVQGWLHAFLVTFIFITLQGYKRSTKGVPPHLPD